MKTLSSVRESIDILVDNYLMNKKNFIEIKHYIIKDSYKLKKIFDIDLCTVHL